MAHFAQIDEFGIVQRVIVVNNSELLDSNGIESESIGISFCSSLLGGTWKQTSYNNNFRKKFAAIGDIYDSEKDIFISQQPWPSWTLDENSDWQPPIQMPKDGKRYFWDEASTSWMEVT